MKRRLNFILISFLIGLFIGSLGLIPGIYLNLDTIAVLIIFFPQAYILSKDNEILLYLLKQKVRGRAMDLHENLSILQQQQEVSHQLLDTEVQALVNFIEKADVLLSERDHMYD